MPPAKKSFSPACERSVIWSDPMPFTAANGVRLHYERAGKGRTVVMVHGLGANLAFWYMRIVPRLADRFSVTVYDLRGHGRSEMPARGYGLAHMAADLAELLDQLEIGTADLIGHSYGAGVALRYALEHPARVRRLVLADAAIPDIRSPADDAIAPKLRTRWRAQLARAGVELGAEPTDSLCWTLSELAQATRANDGPPGAGAADLPQFVPFGWWNSDRAADRWLKLLQTTTAVEDVHRPRQLSREQLRTLTQPALVLCGEHSSWLPAGRRLAAALPLGVLSVLSDVGHFHPIARPQTFADRAGMFLSGEVAA
jgi:pimeloyl-ACP methyl ester carboxylesterase